MIGARSAGVELGVALDAEDGHQRIPGQDPEDHEDDQRHPEQGAEGEERPPEQILLHVRELRSQPPRR